MEWRYPEVRSDVINPDVIRPNLFVRWFLGLSLKRVLRVVGVLLWVGRVIPSVS